MLVQINNLRGLDRLSLLGHAREIVQTKIADGSIQHVAVGGSVAALIRETISRAEQELQAVDEIKDDANGSVFPIR